MTELTPYQQRVVSLIQRLGSAPSGTLLGEPTRKRFNLGIRDAERELTQLRDAGVVACTSGKWFLRRGCP